MTLKEKLAKAKLVNKYTIELYNYEDAAAEGGPFMNFNTTKANEYRAKLDALNELGEST